MTKIILIFVNIVLIAIFVRFFVADTAAKNIDHAIKDTNFEQALKNANLAIQLNPREPYYYRQRAKTFLLLAAQENTDKQIYKNQALNDLQKGLELNEDNLATIRNSIPYYYFLAKSDFALQQDPTLKTNLDANFTQITLDFYKTTKMRFNTDAGAIVTLAKYEKLLGFDKEYAESIVQLKKLRPDLLEWYPGIAY